MTRKPAVIAVMLIGIGVALAPVAFQMFSRAPKGGQMMREFRPFMTSERLGGFEASLDKISAAHAETSTTAAAYSAPETVEQRFPALAAFNQQWPAINEGMSSMLQTITANLPNFAAVNALPPFPLFPWFFVLPGVMIALAARSAWKSSRYVYPRKRLVFLAVMGVGLIAAPAIFQMFTRAPLGAEMLDDFEPVMTQDNVTAMQGAFLVLAGAEGGIRTELAPAVEAAGGSFGADFPAAAAFVEDWQLISADMAPMVGGMSDNLDNYAAVRALPPFGLFPWFFVLPGVLVAALAVAAMRRPAPAAVRKAPVTAPAVE